MGETGAFIAAAIAAYGPEWIRKPIDSVKEFLKLATDAKAVEYQKIALKLDKQLMDAEVQANLQAHRIAELEAAWHAKQKGKLSPCGVFVVEGEDVPYCGTCLYKDQKLFPVHQTGLKLTCGVCKTPYSLPSKGVSGRVRTPYR